MTGLYVASNVTALGAQNVLSNNMSNLTNTLTRLSTGLRINSGKDDPAGLIASEMLKSDMVATSKAITNTQRANSVMAIADSALGQVNSLLNDIRGLVNESANTGAMSASQIAANQLQIDASLDSIDRIARNTNFQGMKLLDGSLDFSTRDVDGKALKNLTINSANFGIGDSLEVKVNVQKAAMKGELNYYGTQVDKDTVVRIGGSEGSEIFKFGAGTTTKEMATAINALSDSTGVVAFVEGAKARGSVTLSSAGSNNDIVIAANEEGFDAGNYTFRITKGLTNDARIVSDPAGKTPGVVEISLVGAEEQNFTNFAGLFNITTDVTDQKDSSGAGNASVNITRGNSNKVQFLTEAANASGTGQGGATISANVEDSSVNGQHTSELNGWTIVIGGASASPLGTIDTDAKTITFGSDIAENGTNVANASEIIANALAVAIGDTNQAANPAISGGANTGNVSISGTLKVGDRITLSGGGDKNELLIQYAAGATVGQIQDLINKAPNVQASLANGVNRADIIKNLPNGSTYATKDEDAIISSKYASGATSQEVIDLINSKLGDKFLAESLTGDGSGGRVTYQDAYADYGSVNEDNALRFTGMDDGPIVRLVSQDQDGVGIANQELSVQILPPSEKDVAAGIHTKVLQINLATDGSGNSITTAKQIADLFDRLTPAETLGVSAELLLAPAVDPNGRRWETDECNNTTVTASCDVNFGNGIVQPNAIPGCEPTLNDLYLLGNNEKKVDDRAWVGFQSSTSNTPSDQAAIAAVNANNTITFGNTSAFNGMSFNFTANEKEEGFNETTGMLTVFIPANANIDASNKVDVVKNLVNGAIDANWEAIRSFTHYSQDRPATGMVTDVKLVKDTAAGIIEDFANGAAIPTSNSKNTVADANTPVFGTRGWGNNEDVLKIIAKDAGTDMAGVKIYFEQDDTKAVYAGTTAAAVDVVDLETQYFQQNDGSMALLVKLNQLDASGNVTAGISVEDLAAALNGDATFSSLFTAEELRDGKAANNSAGVGTIDTTRYASQHAAITQGGYKVTSSTTSSGIGMTGQSDSNERLVMQAKEFGSEHFVNVTTIEGSFDTYCPLGSRLDRLAGKDAVATINGQHAAAKGNVISTSQFSFEGSMDVSGMKAGQTTAFTVNGGGAVFQLGPDVVSTQQIRVGIQSVDTASLGGASGKLYQLKSGGNADMTTNTGLADKIVQEAISAISTTRGRIGAIQRSTLDPNIQALQDNLEALTSAEADISNADFAEESSNMARYQILVQSAASVLGQANQLPQYAAMLVG